MRARARVASFGASMRQIHVSSTCNHSDGTSTSRTCRSTSRCSETPRKDVKAQLPILQTAKVREFRGGIPTMTADGHHIVGPAPAVNGFFFASGCNVAGLSISPAIGEALAMWIVDGNPPVDLSAMALARFTEKPWSEEMLKRDAAWQYRHFYGAA